MGTGRTSSDDDLRQRFLHAARSILTEPETSLDLRKVAERAGKSRTAPYLVFGRTEEGGGLAALQAAVAGDGFRELGRRMHAALEAAEDPEEGLLDMAAAYLAFARDEPRLFRLMFGRDVALGLAAFNRDASIPPGDPRGPGARERLELREARARAEWLFLRAIYMEQGGYLRRHGAFPPEQLAGAVWAMLHGVAMLTIDDQWEATELGRLDDPKELALRTLRFLATASSDEIKPAEAALRKAMLERSKVPSVDDASPETLATLAEPPVPYTARPALPAPDSAAVSGIVASAALRRARGLLHLIRGARILWIDDRPELTQKEAEVFMALGAVVTRAQNTEEAVAGLETGEFHLIVSDIAREKVHDEGIRALPLLREKAPGAPVVFYVARHDPDSPPPPGSFGITNDPEELVHLVFDALERTRV